MARENETTNSYPSLVKGNMSTDCCLFAKMRSGTYQRFSCSSGTCQPVFEGCQFTGTYLGPYEGIYNFNNNSGVIDVGGSYAIVSTSKLHGLEGKTVTVKGYFVNDKAETKTVYINGRYVNGEIFCIEEVV